jgi:hypothetical protein
MKHCGDVILTHTNNGIFIFIFGGLTIVESYAPKFY